MSAISNSFGSMMLAFGLAAVAAAAEPPKTFYPDDPLWISPQPVPVKPAARKLSDYYDFFENTFLSQGQRPKHQGDPLPALATNTVDEVPDSAWYTNRHARRRMTLEELRAGAGNALPPAPGTWIIVAAKNEGITPGFRIRDAAGREYMLKFDPPSNPEMASAADVISSKFFHALGYNVPENYVVRFERQQLAVDPAATIREAGRKRLIRDGDVEALLARVARPDGGVYRGMASRLIAGKPIGPFLYHGTRGDDPNDLVDHEHRRDLRGLRTLCAWLGHNDSRAINTLDVVANDHGTPYVKHYLIDFGATLGSASTGPNSPRDGNAYFFDWKASAVQFFSLGLYVPRWQDAKYPKLPSVGRFEYEVFDPERWVGDYPNAAFRNETVTDRAWAARKIAAFSEADIRAIVATGQYSNPIAEDWVSRCLVERRKKIVDAFLGGLAGLDGFTVRNGQLAWSYAGSGAPPEVQVQWFRFENGAGERRVVSGERSTRIPRLENAAEYLVAELSEDGEAISVYVRMTPNGPFVVGVDRRLQSGASKLQSGVTHVGS